MTTGNIAQDFTTNRPSPPDKAFRLAEQSAE